MSRSTDSTELIAAVMTFAFQPWSPITFWDSSTHIKCAQRCYTSVRCYGFEQVAKWPRLRKIGRKAVAATSAQRRRRLGIWRRGGEASEPTAASHIDAGVRALVETGMQRMLLARDTLKVIDFVPRVASSRLTIPGGRHDNSFAHLVTTVPTWSPSRLIGLS